MTKPEEELLQTEKNLLSLNPNPTSFGQPVKSGFNSATLMPADSGVASGEVQPNSSDDYSTFENEDVNSRGRALLEDLYKAYDNRVKQQKEHEKMGRGQAFINGIADMGRALTNMYYTTQYAHNAYEEQNSLSARSQERIAKAKAEYDKDRDALLNYALMLDKLDEGERSWKFKLAQARAEQKRKEKEAEEKAARQAVEDDQWEEEMELKRQIAADNKALKEQQIKKSGRSGGGGGRSGGSSSYKVITLDDGKELHIPTKRYTKTNLRTSWNKYYNMGSPGDFDAWVGQNLDDPEVLEELFSLAGEDWDAYDNKPMPRATSRKKRNSPREVIMNTLKEGEKQFNGNGNRGY